jgi:hypothetical protein
MRRKGHDVESSLLAAWHTNNLVTIRFIERLPPTLWNVAVPGVPRRTIRAIAARQTGHRLPVTTTSALWQWKMV